MALLILSGCGQVGSSGSASPGAAAAADSAVAASAGPDQTLRKPTLRVYRSPYSEVSWAVDYRIKAQHHDHVGVSRNKLRAYDAAGYHVVALLDYSGAPGLSYALKSRLWPAHAMLPVSFTSTLGNIRLFLPAAEEVGDPVLHVTSPFLTSYIQRWDPSSGPRKPGEYETVTQMRSMIEERGGMALLAHSWHENLDVSWVSQFAGMEIYNAFAEWARRRGTNPFFQTDRNVVMKATWDKALARNQALIGIAVNDHFGPAPDFPADADLQDSGKIIVLASDFTLEAYRNAFQRGAVLAVVDRGTVKDRYPSIRSITAADTQLRIDTDGTVAWVAMGQVVGRGSTFLTRDLPLDATYVRAEISNADGSIVHTQAFSIRPVGDADGDNDLDSVDTEICRDVSYGADRNPEHVMACASMRP